MSNKQHVQSENNYRIKREAIDRRIDQLKRDIRVVRARDLHGALKAAYCAGAKDAGGELKISSLTFKANRDCQQLMKRLGL